MTQLPENSPTFDLPAGFRFSGVAAGIKPSGRPDVALVVADSPCVAAGVYTRNRIVAAPVVWCRERTPSSTVRAVVTVSGNANACTGERGGRDNRSIAESVAGVVGCDVDDVLVCSTGIIGRYLPMDRVAAGVRHAAESLGGDSRDFVRAAEAIRTTDADRKTAATTFDADGRTYRIAAMAKGAGMIAPDMATLLVTVLTDAPLSPDDAARVLRSAADRSFNRSSVDGHTSTNDTMLLLSSGGSDTRLTGDALRTFEAAVTEVAVDLTKQVVADGEGANHRMVVRVVGADDVASAASIGRTVASSSLVKTAITGGDPNWGRIVSAAGYGAVDFDPAAVGLSIDGTVIYRDGSPVEFDEPDLSTRMKRNGEVVIELIVGRGDGSAEFYASDLTVDYVRFNSEYTT